MPGDDMHFKEPEYSQPDFYDPDVFKKEKEKARRLRQSAWWKKKRSSGICYYCKKQFRASELTMDHKIPLSRGGTSNKENIVPCCKECNTNKRYMLPAEWMEYLKSSNEEES